MQSDPLCGAGTDTWQASKGAAQSRNGLRQYSHGSKRPATQCWSVITSSACQTLKDSTQEAAAHVNPGRLKPAVALPISAVEISFAWPSAWLAALSTISSSSWASAGLIACGSILIEAREPSHLATTFTAPPPLVASTVRLARSVWICSICCCMRAACFMSFPMLDMTDVVVANYALFRHGFPRFAL